MITVLSLNKADFSSGCYTHASINRDGHETLKFETETRQL